MNNLRVSLLSFVLFTLVFINASDDLEHNELGDSMSDQLTGYSVLRILPQSNEQVQFLKKLEQSSPEDQLDFWRSPAAVNMSVDLMLPPDTRQHIEKQLHYHSIPFEEMIKSVESLVENERFEIMRNNLHYEVDFRRPLTFFRNYHNLEEIYAYMTHLETEYPNRVSIESIGKTFEDRQMRLIKIGERTNKEKKIFWIDAGIHAREWIAPAVAMYFADQLVRGADFDPTIAKIIREVDFYILPVANPDGYSFTHAHQTQRLWRKTRSRSDGFLRNICAGADPNRNFDFHWGESGSSFIACSQVYAGAKPFSEPESRAMANKILSIRHNMMAYVALHSYSQLILMPWGYTSALPAAYWEMEDKAKKAVKEISRRYGTAYRAGSSTNILYAASGGADDWVHGVAKVKYAYTIELRDTGKWGFLLPPGQILPTAEETFDGLRNLTIEIGREYGCNF